MRRPLHADVAAPGFTLLEMIVGVMILGLFVVVAMPFLPGPSESLRLRTTARELAGALRFTRASAIARGSELVLAVDVERRTFESPVVPLRSFGRDIVVQMNVAAPERSTPSRGGFRFFADGSSTGGELTLRLRTVEERICVNWLTGEASQGKNC
jgi:general secretion pathway protein H